VKKRDKDGDVDGVDCLMASHVVLISFGCLNLNITLNKGG